MNLQTHIRNDLWLSIQSTYEAHNYSHAILDAIHHLSNVIRDKTGSDGDGVALVGQAFGGESPRLRVNKLQTDTERNEQKGVESILRGLYQAVRNPRSHEQIEDKQETADAVIYFINYLLGIIEESGEIFELPKFLKRVFDSDFYRSEEYAELLVSEIPSNKRFDVLISIYRDKLKGNIYAIELIIKLLLVKLTVDQRKEFMTIVSEELRTINSENEFKYNLYIIPTNYWDQLQEAARMRVENRIIKEIKNGREDQRKLYSGALPTWARGKLVKFKLKTDLVFTFISKLESNHPDEIYYVVNNFFTQLPDLMKELNFTKRYVNAISASVEGGNIFIRNILVDRMIELPDDVQDLFCENLKDLIESEGGEATYLLNGKLFLPHIESPEESDNNLDFPF